MSIYLSKTVSDILGDGFFKDLFDSSLFKREGLPTTDIKEEKDNFIFEMDIPGFDKKDIKVSLEEGNLLVEAEKSTEKEEKDDVKYLRRERVYGKYARTFYVGDIEQEDIKASYENGILKLIVPKEKEKVAEKKKTIIID